MSKTGKPKDFKRDLESGSGIPETEMYTGDASPEGLQGVTFEQLDAASLLDLARGTDVREQAESSGASNSLVIEDLQSRFPELEALECIG